MLVSGDDIPHHFRCPISLDVMSDPVTISTGHTFDRPSIESWLSTGNSTCPVTRSPLSPSSLIPNLTLRRLIHRWRPITTPNNSAASPSLLLSLLSTSSPASNLPELARLASLTRLSQLAHDSDANRSFLSSLPETRRILISILSESAELRNESLSLLALFRLTESESDSIEVELLINLMLEPNPIEVRANAAGVLESALSMTRSRIAAADGVFEAVVGLIRESRKVSLKALLSLCLEKQSRRRAVEAGAMEELIDLLASAEEVERGDVERAVATVELLCRVPEGCAAFLGNEKAVAAIVRTMLKVSGRATEHAAGALLGVCRESEWARREAVEAGVVSRLLLVVQSGCTERGKRKAQSLLKLLRDSVGISDGGFCCSDVVPYSIRK